MRGDLLVLYKDASKGKALNLAIIHANLEGAALLVSVWLPFLGCVRICGHVRVLMQVGTPPDQFAAPLFKQLVKKTRTSIFWFFSSCTHCPPQN